MALSPLVDKKYNGNELTPEASEVTPELADAASSVSATSGEDYGVLHDETGNAPGEEGKEIDELVEKRGGGGREILPPTPAEVPDEA